ncbi:MAG: glutamyl-tRNA reductase [Candidatus Obscuribacterales bacterium]|nr:glutamyl-tRNA reductase [Candidatus Obscuribacterales bacterium]
MNLNESHNWTRQEKATQESATAHLVVMGINYHSCPIFIREKFVIPDSCIKHALAALARMPHLREAAIISTCNRTEVYAVVSDVQAGLAEIESFFMATQSVGDHEKLKPNFKLLRDDVALHLFRVAAGLDSLVLGEAQIMSQVKSAHRHALQAGTAGPILGQLFQSALNCGKRVRSETTLGRKAVSVSSAAIEMARELLGPLHEKSALIIGAGHMAQICAKHLLGDSGARELIMVNRTSERLEHFVGNNLPNKEKLNLRFNFADRQELAAASDLVIVSTSAPGYVLKKSDFKSSSKQVCIIDISVPRNVDPEISEIENLRLYHADDISGLVSKNLAEREALSNEAEKIVFEALEEFHAWERSLLVAPTIIELRKKIEAIRAEHLVKAERKCDEQSAGGKDAFEELSRALINQILHHPTTQLKSTSDYWMLKQQAEALRKLFNLDHEKSPVCKQGFDSLVKTTI